MGHKRRFRIAHWLARPLAARVIADVGAGTGFAIGAVVWHSASRSVTLWQALFVTAALGLLAGWGVAFLFVDRLRFPALVAWLPTASRAARLAVAVVLSVIVGAGVLLVGWLVSAMTRMGLAAALVSRLPAGFVVVSGSWAAVLVSRQERGWRWRWPRFILDVLVAAVTALAVVLLFHPGLLAAHWAAVLLFPVGGWLSFRIWRAMGSSRRLAVHAGADIVLSLLLGASVLLFGVWVANRLDLAPAEVTALRGLLERAGSAADLPWWLWAALYALLAGASLAMACWPQRLAGLTRWYRRYRVVPVVSVSRRVLSGVHIGLCVSVLIGMTAPTALAGTLHGQLKAKYTVALRRELAANTRRAAYQEIRGQFRAPVTTPRALLPLSELVSEIHDTGGQQGQQAGQPGGSVTGTELDLARRIGQAQASALLNAPPGSPMAPPPEPPQPAPGAAPGGQRFDPPIQGAADLRDRLGRLGDQQRKTASAVRHADQAAELAASAVAGAIQVPGLSGNEAGQIVREYLSGLLESGPLTRVFTSWARRLANGGHPQRAERLVVPDPPQLETAVILVLVHEKSKVLLADPTTADPVTEQVRHESSIAAAVDLMNEARYFAERSGPCDGCPRLLRPGEEPRLPGEGPGDHPVEPPPEHHPIP